jgi:lysophospholipase L1-like esterase
MFGRTSWRRALMALPILVGLAAQAPAASAAGYVGLGDSYAAGPAIPLYEQPWGCLKSTNNYAHRAASLLGLTLKDVSCSGAETEDMTQAQGVTPGPNPPQFNALDASTRVVSIHIGGNDIGFSSIAQDCFDTTPANQGTPCRDKYVVAGRDEVSARIAETAPKVAATVQGIRTRAPNARVLVLNYPAIFPHTGGGCWPQIPVADGDVAWLRSKQEELNRMVGDAAVANGAVLVDVYAASQGHDACRPPVIRWVEPVVPASPAAPVHPNLIGMLAMADMVAATAR